MTKPTFIVDANLIAAAAIFKAKADVRSYLEGIRIEPHPDKGIFVIGTDGHRMLIAHDEYGTADQAITIKPTTAFIAAAKKAKGLFGTPAKAICNDGLLFITIAATETCFTPEVNHKYTPFIEAAEELEGTYPDWQRIMPEKISANFPVAAMNHKYVADISKALQIFTPSTRHPIAFRFYSSAKTADEADSTSVIAMSSSPLAHNLLFVIMPMREQHKAQSLPGWMPPKTEEKAA